MAILKLRDENGNVVEVPALRGPQGVPGKDAFEVAVDMGYTGTLEEWIGEHNGLNVLQKIDIDPNALGLEQDPETGLVYPTYSGIRSETGIPLAATGGVGGGGGSFSYTITLSNLMETRAFAIPQGGKAEIRFSYSSVDSEGIDDGVGIGTVYVGGVKMATFNAKQGENTIDVSAYLGMGENPVRLKVENTDGLSKSIGYTINVVSLSITTTHDLFTINSGVVTFYYTLVGDGDKTVHFIMDGEEIDSAVVSTTGRSRSFNIPAQSHGDHIFEVYADISVGEDTVTSNTLKLGMIWVESGNETPIICSMFDRDEAIEGETLSISYLAYHPLYENPDIILSVIDENNIVYSTKTITIDRTEQTWSVRDYPAGQTTFRMTLGVMVLDHVLTITEDDNTVATVTDGLAFAFDPTGRSNGEENPAQWTDGNVTATFSGIGFSAADGWIDDDNGQTMLRLLPGGEMVIPYTLFSTDKRDNGATIEVEMATHNVRDYDSIVMSCLSVNRGFKIASQYAQLNSEQSEVSMQFKEDEKVRVSFVIEPKNLNRLIYVYVDGIMCGVIQYPDDDNFQQSPAVGITIGAETSGIDVYRIYLYDKGLTRNEIISNYIADRATLTERKAAQERNDILNVSEEIVISKLPSTLPYMIIHCAELPQFKGDKKTCEITYVNPSDSRKSFTAKNVKIDVQGTSSAGYKKKNFKFTLENGLTLTLSGEVVEAYSLRDESIPVKTFCMKADVASSEGANNVELVRLYNDICPYKTAAQVADSRVRVGIDGLPCVIFWQNTDTGVTKFWGKYNFNNDKATAEVYGLTAGCESWEIKNNISPRVLFQESDYAGNDWLNDFEARYPEDNTNFTNLKRMTDWVVSTNRAAVSSQAEKAARLEKFKMEFEDYFVKTPMLFYYIFTETFLMVDNRAKNFFPSTYDGIHWMPLPYDMDTAIGINNEGQLVFDYDLEDTDHVGSSDVFNGQDSVLWCNIRDAFGDELQEMYAELRTTTGTPFAYDKVVERFKEHQQVWPEVVWNEDAWEKCLEPLVNDGDDSYLTMLQGNKASQREWWLFNGFRYRDSKYQTGDAEKQYITLRCYASGDITVTPYSHIHPRIKYGSYTETVRGKRNVPVTLPFVLNNLNDTEVYIYSADRLVDIGDLSPLQVGWADFHMATKLQKVKIGDGAAGYTNTMMTHLNVGNNDLLTELDIRNCVNLTEAVDLSECDALETVLAGGSGVTSIRLAVGGKVKRLELPATITNLTIRDQKQLETLTLEGYSNITTLRIENTPNVPIETILNSREAFDRVRLIGVNLSLDDVTLVHKLMRSGGLDATGGNTEKSVWVGTLHLGVVASHMLEEIRTYYPNLHVTYDVLIPTYRVSFVDWDGIVLYSEIVEKGHQATTENPVADGLIDAPTRASTAQYHYSFNGFDNNYIGTTVTEHRVYTAQYTGTLRSYTVNFYIGDALWDSVSVPYGSKAICSKGDPSKDPTASTMFVFAGWSPINGGAVDVSILNNITGDKNVYVVFNEVIRTFTVRFYNGDTLLQSDTLEYGTMPVYRGDEPVDSSGDGFSGWIPAINIVVSDMDYVAKFTPASVMRALVQGTLRSYEDDELTSIARTYAFYNCDELMTVDLPKVTTIGDCGFYSCDALTFVNIPLLTKVSQYLFQDCTSLVSVEFLNATEIVQLSFSGCTSLKNVNIPNATFRYGSNFKGCVSLEVANFPKATTIPNANFSGCTALKTVNIPNVTSIDSNAFKDCGALETVILPATPPTLSNVSAFTNINSACVFYIPTGSLVAYQSAVNWSSLTSTYSFIEEDR